MSSCKGREVWNQERRNSRTQRIVLQNNLSLNRRPTQKTVESHNKCKVMFSHNAASCYSNPANTVCLLMVTVSSWTWSQYLTLQCHGVKQGIAYNPGLVDWDILDSAFVLTSLFLPFLNTCTTASLQLCPSCSWIHIVRIAKKTGWRQVCTITHIKLYKCSSATIFLIQNVCNDHLQQD